MIAERPLGSGGDAFKSELGLGYITNAKWHYQAHALQNGYLNQATSWGVQGLTLYLTAFFLAWRLLRRGVTRARAQGDFRTAFLGNCIEAALVVNLVATVFISNLRAEWYFWWCVLALTYERQCGLARENVTDSGDGHVVGQGSLLSQHESLQATPDGAVPVADGALD